MNNKGVLRRNTAFVFKSKPMATSAEFLELSCANMGTMGHQDIVLVLGQFECVWVQRP